SSSQCTSLHSVSTGRAAKNSRQTGRAGFLCRPLCFPSWRRDTPVIGKILGGGFLNAYGFPSNHSLQRARRSRREVDRVYHDGNLEGVSGRVGECPAVARDAAGGVGGVEQ